MGKKPKAPDMSFQIQAANKQEAELAKQRAELDAKNSQIAVANTEKLKGLRRRQSGRSVLSGATTTQSGA